ncbi:10645_t:CDS:2 [Entrophospora sp. SA101]|nr:10645_t:CDS:2 [Entrophospora sp. SA101]
MEKFGENSADNLIICGDSLNALTSLTKIPEYRKKYVNKVKLIYIDPPFNTGQMFANYDDQLEHSIYKNPDNDPRGSWIEGDFTIGEITGNRYSITTPGKERNNVPRIKFFLSEASDLMPTTWWSHEEAGHNNEAKKEILKLFPDIEPFQTPKPERLLQRIIQIATNEGDIVLDYFAGSGTTAAVAQKLRRKWVIVEKNEDTVNTFAVPRLKKVISGEDKGGIMEKSMFDTHSGIICLAENVLNGKLAKLVATQLEYDYQPENEYFCGKKGDVLLAVVEGMLTDGLLNFLLNSKEEKQFLEVAALAVDPDLESKNYNNVKIELLNLKNLEFKLAKEGITIIVGQNNTGKTRLLNYIYQENENWDKLNEKYERDLYKFLSIFFWDNLYVCSPTHKEFIREEKMGDIKCSYDLYYFDLSSSFSLINKQKGQKEIKFENRKSRACEVYYTEKNMEKGIRSLNSVVMKKVEKTIYPEPLLLDYKDEEGNFDVDAEYGTRGRNYGMKISHSLTDVREIYVPILIIDEPEVLLHPVLTNKVVSLIKKLENESITTILTTHSPTFLSQFIHDEKVNLVLTQKEEGNLKKPLYFWKIINAIKEKVKEGYKKYARKRMTEYILFNNILKEKLSKELEKREIEIIPIFEDYGERHDNNENTNIFHTKNTRISWVHFNIEEFLGIPTTDRNKEYNLISRAGDRNAMLNQIILDNISKKLELREPNQKAVQAFLNHYYKQNQNSEKLADRRLDNFNKLSECILSVATGVGKTYIIAAILNYLAEAEKITNFLIVAPGKIIREKTINNFSVNKPNSLVDKMIIKNQLKKFILTSCKKNIMNKSNKTKPCEKCGSSEIEKKEIYHDEDKNDAYHVTTYSLYYCKNCGPEKKKLAELNY